MFIINFIYVRRMVLIADFYYIWCEGVICENDLVVIYVDWESGEIDKIGFMVGVMEFEKCEMNNGIYYSYVSKRLN